MLKINEKLFNKFLNEEIVISCQIIEEFDEFMKLIEKTNPEIRWTTGVMPTNKNPRNEIIKNNYKKVAIVCGYNRKMRYATPEWYGAEEHLLAISFKELIKKEYNPYE